ncbi:MAG TPA: tyrosine--tRNA ligase, partial [Stellaceae bacterium]|nr:tyrosine--tRNA ligase [Stellaceae bacterium]
ELARRSDGRALYGLTTPLVTTASGAKMGKTAQGAIWLNAERLSPFEYWQFWRNTEDADVGRFLRLFTELPLDEIARLEQLRDAEINEAKEVLAYRATELAHGRDAAEEAANGELPEVVVPRGRIRPDTANTEPFVLAGLVSSKGEARRLIRDGGARINDRVVVSETETLGEDALRPLIKLSAGRKRHVILRVV